MSPQRRTALRNVGGPIRVRGAEDEAKILRAAWEAAEQPADTLTHGFHAYPARLHRGVAASVLAACAPAGGRVLDPFCGSGTVLLEAMVGGWRSVGVDLNAVALRIAEVKCARRSQSDRERFAATLDLVVESSLDRVASKVRARAPLSPEQRRLYQPHVLLELAGLYEEIGEVPHEADRRALQVLLSAIVVKFSKRRADTSQAEAPKQIGRSVPTRFFHRKGQELLRRWAEVDSACADLPHVHAPDLREGDARHLQKMLGPKIRFDLVLTSPPYGGTYDYLQHHALRFAWLGIKPTKLARGEIGARRNLGRAEDAKARWDAELGEVLAQLAAVLRPEGRAVLVIGDAQVGGRSDGQRVRADRQLEQLAPEHGLQFLAVASQRRTDWQGGRSRFEHIVSLMRRDPG